MQFDNWTAFWHMGGYGFYVWLAFFVTLASMILLVVESRFARSRLKQQVLTEAARKARIRNANERNQESASTPKSLKEV